MPLPEIWARAARRYGPLLETHPSFPDRTNVQFLAALAGARIRIEIWERGAGYTLASGSSSCAAAAVARRLGCCERGGHVHMPGGALAIDVGDDYAVLHERALSAKIAEGVLSEELLHAAPADERGSSDRSG